jgi:hypothetical protein
MTTKLGRNRGKWPNLHGRHLHHKTYATFDVRQEKLATRNCLNVTAVAAFLFQTARVPAKFVCGAPAYQRMNVLDFVRSEVFELQRNKR